MEGQDSPEYEFHHDAARRASVLNSTPLVVFLYVLLRDHLPAGSVEAILVEHVEKVDGQLPVFSNPHLEAYAREIAEKLTPIFETLMTPASIAGGGAVGECAADGQS